jgi:hypothetical protein
MWLKMQGFLARIKDDLFGEKVIFSWQKENYRRTHEE